MARLTHLLIIITLFTVSCVSSSSNDIMTTKDFILATLGHTDDSLAFAEFAEEYGKRYESVEEINKRFAVFKDRVKKIKSHNEKGLSFTVGINQFSDMTWEEFEAKMLFNLNESGNRNVHLRRQPQTH